MGVVEDEFKGGGVLEKIWGEGEGRNKRFWGYRVLEKMIRSEGVGEDDLRGGRGGRGFQIPSI